MRILEPAHRWQYDLEPRANGQLRARVPQGNRRCRWEHRDPEETSCPGGHLARDQEIDFTTVVFVVHEALIDLGSGQFRKAVGNDGINALTVLQQTNDIVDTDAGCLDHGMAAPNLRQPCDVPILLRSSNHDALMVGEVRLQFKLTPDFWMRRCGWRRLIRGKRWSQTGCHNLTLMPIAAMRMEVGPIGTEALNRKHAARPNVFAVTVASITHD